MGISRRYQSSRLFGLFVAMAATACGVESYANAPDGIYGSFGNLTNTNSVSYGVQQDGVDFFGVEEEVQGNFSASFSANPFYGSEDNGFFSVSGSAGTESVNGILRASAQVTVDENSVSNFNAPYLVGDTSDPDGIPTRVDFDAFAGFTDRLQFNSTATGYTSRYLIRVTGQITAPGAFVAIDINNGDGQTETYFYTEVGQINDVIATNSVAVLGDQQEFSITVQATASVSPEFDLAGASNAALFSNTLEVIGLEVRDETGALAPTGFVTTGGGATPTITAVPEPTTAGLFACLSVLAASIRRRK